MDMDLNKIMNVGHEEEEDFSFPIFVSTQNLSAVEAEAISSIDSPPLWHLSPANSPVHSSNRKQEAEKCFPEAKLEDEDDDDDKADKMDTLWEDFNMTEELSSKSKSNPTTIYLSGGGDLKLSKNYKNNTNCAIFSSRKPKLGMIVFIKLLKKLVLLHNSHHHPSIQKNRPWRS